MDEDSPIRTKAKLKFNHVKALVPLEESKSKHRFKKYQDEKNVKDTLKANLS